MDEEGYYAGAKRLGLTPSKVKHIYIDREGECRRVPPVSGLTPEQIDEAFKELTRLVNGLGPPD